MAFCPPPALGVERIVAHKPQSHGLRSGFREEGRGGGGGSGGHGVSQWVGAYSMKGELYSRAANRQKFEMVSTRERPIRDIKN